MRRAKRRLLLHVPVTKVTSPRIIQTNEKDRLRLRLLAPTSSPWGPQFKEKEMAGDWFGWVHRLKSLRNPARLRPGRHWDR